MIVPTVAIKDEFKRLHVYNLTQFVKFMDYAEAGEDYAVLTFPDKEYEFKGENAAIIRSAVAFVNNTYQEQKTGYEQAKAQASQLIAPVNGRIVQ